MLKAFWLIITLSISLHCHAAVKLSEGKFRIEQFSIGYFIDQSQALTLETVQSKSFVPSLNRVSLGGNAKTTWAKFSITNPTEQNISFYIHNKDAYHAKSLTLYQLTGSDTIKQHIDLDSQKKNPLMFGGTAIFAVNLAPNTTSEFYFRHQVYSHQWFSLSIYDDLSSKKALVGEHYDIAIMVGMLMSLMIYNLLLFITSRKKENIFYALYLISGVIWIALSYGLLANLFCWYGKAVMPVHLSLIAMPAFLILFMMSIFDTRKSYPVEHKALVFVLFLLICDFIYGIFDITGALKPASSLAALMIMVTLCVTLSILKKGNAIAKYFLLGHILFFVCNLSAIGYYKGILPNNYFTSHGVGFGIMLESFMLAFVLSYRIKLLESLKAEQAELQHQANTDPLTQLYNRRYFDIAVTQLLQASPKANSHLCVLITDIDYFKRVNDKYGHQTGDEVLISFADILRNELPKNAIIARLGGEEFIIALPHTSLVQAAQTAEQLREKVAELSIVSTDNHLVSITASIGISDVNSSAHLKQSIIKADKALYLAKDSGRNQVVIFDEQTRQNLNLVQSPQA